MPRVSVIIPTYNRADFLEAAAASVFKQTFTDFEVIIVDDGSRDNTGDVCERLCAIDSRVRYIHQENTGLPGARNTGIRAARGEFIALLDSDDLWVPTKLEKQLAVVERDPGIDIVYCDYACIDASGKTWPPVYTPEYGQTLYDSLLYYNVVRGSASAVLIRAECFNRVGLFDESLRSMEDWDMWLRLAQLFKFEKAPEVLVYLFQHSGQMQGDSGVMAESQLALLRKLRMSIPKQYAHHLPRVTWHYHLVAAELYCADSRRRCWSLLLQAARSYPPGLLSLRTWYFLTLALTGPLYPHANATGLVMRRWCYRYLKLNTVTGWRGPVAR